MLEIGQVGHKHGNMMGLEALFLKRPIIIDHAAQ